MQIMKYMLSEEYNSFTSCRLQAKSQACMFAQVCLKSSSKNSNSWLKCKLSLQVSTSSAVDVCIHSGYLEEELRTM